MNVLGYVAAVNCSFNRASIIKQGRARRALLACPECSVEMADNAVSCPRFGWKNKHVATR